jgi:basic membrane lipoprotein Med (substrate-binding protein (PBP1-ABC) superfamily)
MGGKPRSVSSPRKAPRLLLTLVVAAVAVAGCVAGVLIAASGSGATPSARVRQFGAAIACLLTDSRGLAGSPAAQVWAGMQDASQATHAKVEYLQVYGTTAAAARPYLASLVQRRCGVVLAVGSAQVSAVAADAGRYPAVRFVAISSAASSRDMTTVDPATGQVRISVARLIRADVQT